MMSVPRWTRPPLRAAPHVSEYVHGAWTGLAASVIATPDGAAVVVVAGAGGTGAHCVATGPQAPIRTAAVAPNAPSFVVAWDVMRCHRVGALARDVSGTWVMIGAASPDRCAGLSRPS